MSDEVPRRGDPEAIRLHNVRTECLYSVLSGVFMGMAIYVSLVVAQTCLQATQVHLTVLMCAFPCGAFLGSQWAKLGQRWGMKELVLRMGVLANLLLFLIPFADRIPGLSPATSFTAIIAVSQLLFSAVRMGQSSLYRCTYPSVSRGRVTGWFITLSFMSMVPTAYLAGCLIDPECRPETHPWLAPLFILLGEHGCQPVNYRWLYPLAGCCGLLGCWFYRRLILLEQPHAGPSLSLRQSWARVVQVMRQDRKFFWFQAGFFLNGSAFFLSAHVMVKLCNEEMHFSASQMALALVALPQILLAGSSWMWGRVMDYLGIVQLRFIVAVVMTAYLGCYVCGLWWHLPWLIYLGGVLRGVAEGGGQVTWALASVHFAPETEDVPIYNSIHFTLNGTRGLLMPVLGSQLFLLIGSGTILISMAMSACGIFVNARNSRRPERGGALPPVTPTLRLPAASGYPSASKS